MSKLGIGIITYNRLAYLQTLVEQLVTFTRSPFELVVADDGSTDGTVAWCQEQGIRVITGRNHGVAWNKNRALYYFMSRTDCDPILLLEDDVRLWEPGWESEWITAARGWHHVNWTQAQPEEVQAGTGTPHDPLRTSTFGGSCTISSRQALGRVGYLNTQFRGYGVEHVNWTWRFARAYADLWGEPAGTVPCFTPHIGVVWEISHYNPREMQANQLRHEAYMADPRNYYEPWSSPEEAAELEGEIQQALTENAGWKYQLSLQLPPEQEEQAPPSAQCPWPSRWRQYDARSPEVEVLEFLESLVRALHPNLVVETGCFRGWGTYHLARGLVRNGHGRLVTCDEDGFLCELTRERCAGLPVEVQHTDGLALTVPGPIDLLFLDSGPRMAVLEALWGQLSPRAVLVVHDTTVIHPELGAALDQWADAGRLERLHLPTPRGLTLARKRA